MTLEEQVQKLTAERDEEEAIVDRVWAALGISTYEQAKPLAIDEHVKRIIAERDAALKACAEMRDALIPFQCETCNGTHRFTFECPSCLSGEGECTCDKQQPEPCPQCQSDNGCKEIYARLERAISSDCGKGYVKAESLKCFKCDDGHTPLYCLNCAREGYHHDDEWKVVVEALDQTLDHLKVMFDIDGRPLDPNDREIVENAERALAHAEKLMSQ